MSKRKHSKRRSRSKRNSRTKRQSIKKAAGTSKNLQLSKPSSDHPYIIADEPDYYVLYKPPFWKVNVPPPWDLKSVSNYDNYTLEQQRDAYTKDKIFQLYCKFELGITFPPTYGVCHRYDKETSGCILVVKEHSNFQLCQTTISDKKNTVKLYVTLVNGILTNKSGYIYTLIECQIQKSKNNTPFLYCQSLDAEEGDINSASYYEVVEEYEYLNPEDNKTYTFSLVQVRIFTGRTHQIRLHMNSIGHCVVSDRTYCVDKQMNSQIADRLFLHNFYLSFKWSDETKEYNMGLPPDLQSALDKLKSVKKYKKLQDVKQLLIEKPQKAISTKFIQAKV